MNSPLAVWRKNTGLTQGDIAKLAGVSQAHVSEIECCTTNLCPALESLLNRIAERGSSDIAREAANVAERHAAFMRVRQAQSSEAALPAEVADRHE